jgi:tyrosine-protein kinase Etk/Wzc
MSNPAIKPAEGNDNLFSKLWFRYFPYWELFVVLLWVSLISAWLYLKYKVPVYESTTTILIKDEKKGLDDSKMLESLNLLATKKIIENEIEVLRSRSLMHEVVNKLHLYAPVFEEGRWAPKSAYNSSPVKILHSDPDLLEQTGKIYFTIDSTGQQIIVGKESFPLNQWVNTPYGMLKFAENATVTDFRNRRFYFSLINPRQLTQALTGSLNIVPASKLSTVLYLKIRDQVPERGEDILDELVLAYNKAAINDKNSLAVNTLSFVEERLNFVAHDLDSIEREIQSYKSRKGAIDIGAQGRLFLQNVSDNDQKLGEVNMQLAVLDQIEAYLVSKDKQGGIVPSTLGINDPMLTKLLDKLYTFELEYERLRKTTAENNPLLVSISDQIAKIEPGIMENIQSRRRSLEAGKQNLYSTNGMYASLLQGIPQKERELVDISREQSIKNDIYTFLLQKREEAALSHSSTVADSRIVDKAESTLSPVSPNKKLYYIIAVLAGFFAGIGIITIRELFNKKILFRQEIENFTSIPIIGELVQEKLESNIVIGEGKSSFLSEQFRRLRAVLPHLGVSGMRHKILITSTISGEGKSFVAVNLALSLALIGKKVVLLECDLVNPTLGQKLGQYQEKGMGDYLMEQAEPEEIIKRSRINENLFFVSAGKLPFNPSELIMGKKTQDLLQYLDDVFEYVIIDTAPTGPSSDAYILSHYCDATLYIIRHKYTPKILVQRLDDNNKVTRLKNTAIIFNGIRSRGFQKDNYGFGYGYGYSHNYVAEVSKAPKKKRVTS